MQQLRSAIHNAIARFLKNQPPARIIAVGFALLILLGAALLMLPFAVHPGAHVGPLDALFTATSAVCVTGLVVVDTGDTFSLFGQAVIAILIQIGGLGVASIGMGLALVAGRRISLKGRSLVREALNVESLEGMVRLVRAILLMTLICEVAGAALSFPSFARDHMPLQAVWLSIFHSIAAFNNAGFDALGGGQSLIPYQNDLLLNLVTDALVIVGGIGFMVILDVGRCRGQFRRMTFHTKVVLSTTAVLLVGGAVLLQLTDHMGWLAALFQSMTARTAGFSSVDLGSISNAGLLVIMILMFIGASPGSTAGGIKTSTFFVLIQGIKSAATNHTEKAFHYAIPKGAFRKASVITILGGSIVFVCTYLLSILEPQIPLIDLLFESVSAFGTVGLSTGITTQLCTASKLLCILVMYIGRLGPLTIFSIWHYSLGERVRYPEGNISIG